jgi:hypothetical protein
MEQKSDHIKIQICKTGQVREGIGHLLESKVHLWDGINDFNLFKANKKKKRSDVPNYKFEPEENINIIVNLKTVIMYLCVNRFLKLSSLKKIVRERFLKEYNKSSVFEDEITLP